MQIKVVAGVLLLPQFLFNIRDRWHFISYSYTYTNSFAVTPFTIAVVFRFPIDKAELIGLKVALCTCCSQRELVPLLVLRYFARLPVLIINKFGGQCTAFICMHMQVLQQQQGNQEKRKSRVNWQLEGSEVN